MTASRLLALACALLLAAAPAQAQLTLSRTAVGVTSIDATGGTYSLRASLGEAVVGTVSGGSLELCQGIGCVTPEDPQDYVVTNPIANNYFAWGQPINVRYTTAPGTPSGNVRISLLCEGQAPYVVRSSAANSGAWGFLMPAAVGVHGGPADPMGGCVAEVALVSDPSYAGTSPRFVIQDAARAITVTEPTRLDRYGLQGRFHWRWDPADIQTTGNIRLSLVCEGREEFIRFNTPVNDGNQGYELPADFGAYDNCHAQVAEVDDLRNYGRGGSFEILDEPLPAVEVTAPVAGTVWAAGTTRTIAWNTVSTDANVNMYIFLDNFTPGASPFIKRLAITPNDGSFSWAIPASQPAGTEYRIRMAAYAQDGSLIRNVKFPFTITAAAPLARRAEGEVRLTEVAVPGIPLERGWTRVEVPTPTDITAWLAPLAETAGRVVARDDAGRTLSVTAAGAVGDLRSLAAGTALDVWVDADAVLGEAPAARATRAAAPPRVAFADGGLDASPALWTVEAPGLADGDEIAVLRGDVVVGRGVVSDGAADVVVLSNPDATRAGAPRTDAARGGPRPAEPTRNAARAETAPEIPLATPPADPHLANHADATPLTLQAWPAGSDAPLALAVASVTPRFGAALADDAPLAFTPGDVWTLTLDGDAIAAKGGSADILDGGLLAGAPDVPDVLTLDAVAPNPARGAATVRIGLPEAGPLTARVFDVRGREVAALSLGAERGAGWHTVEVPAERLASGVYVVRVETAGEVVARTFTVVR